MSDNRPTEVARKKGAHSDPRKELNGRGFLRDLGLAAAGAVFGFMLAVPWDVLKLQSEHRAEIKRSREEQFAGLRAISNVVYAQILSDYRKLLENNKLLREEMRLVATGRDNEIMDVSAPIKLYEDTESMLPLMAPLLATDIATLNRLIAVGMNARGVNAQIERHETLRSLMLDHPRARLALMRTDSLLIANNRKLMGVIESPDTLYKRINVQPFTPGIGP